MSRFGKFGRYVGERGRFTRVFGKIYARNFARLWAYVGMGAADFGWF